MQLSVPAGLYCTVLVQQKGEEEISCISVVIKLQIIFPFCFPSFRVELHKIFQDRSSIRKELLELESFDRDLTAKVMRKTMLVERLRLVHGKSSSGIRYIRIHLWLST